MIFKHQQIGWGNDSAPLSLCDHQIDSAWGTKLHNRYVMEVELAKFLKKIVLAMSEGWHTVIK